MKTRSLILRKAVGLASLGLLAGVLSGCAWSIGGEKGQAVVQPTRGQELIDLQRAYEQGVLTQDQYEQQKRQVLER